MTTLNFNFQVCSKCGEEKPLEDFSKHPQTKSGRNSTCKVCTAKRQKELRMENPAAHMLYAAKYRAKRDNLPFSLVPEDIEIPETCPVLGIPLFICEGKHGANSPTIDKIVPSKGYVKDNIVVISHRANALKSDASLEELKLLVAFYDNT